MGNDQIDTALVERVAQAIEAAYCRGMGSECSPLSYEEQARKLIYPPKTRLQVARELLADNLEEGLRAVDAELTRGGKHDDSPSMQAVLAALALPAMED